MAKTSLRPSAGRTEKTKSSKHKVEKKLKFYAKVEDASVTLGAKKAISKKKRLRSRQKKLKAYDLSALSEFLPDLAAAPPSSETTNVKLNCKSRQKLLQRESTRLRAVLNNLAFQMDPVSAIQHHLESTQPPPPVAVKQVGKHNQSGKTKKRNKAKRKDAKGLAASLSSMDIQ